MVPFDSKSVHVLVNSWPGKTWRVSTLSGKHVAKDTCAKVHGGLKVSNQF